MAKCCIEWVNLEDQLVEDSTTLCGGTLAAFDLSSLLTTSQILQSPEYEILSSSLGEVDDIRLNGSTLEVDLLNPDDRPYNLSVLISIVSEDNYKYKVRVKINFLDRCADAECLSNEFCNPCTGDCEEGVVDGSIILRDPTGHLKGSITLI